YSSRDASELADVLREAGYKKVVLLCDREGRKPSDPLWPTKANISRELDALLPNIQKGDVLILAFAGHGIQPDGSDSYFVPIDGDPATGRENTLISLTALYTQLSKSRQGAKLLLVDACRDDPKVASRSATSNKPAHPASGVAALFSCAAGK